MIQTEGDSNEMGIGQGESGSRRKEPRDVSILGGDSAGVPGASAGSGAFS
jgi:hypothetical protein